MKKFSLFLASGLMAVGMYAQSNITFKVDMKNETVAADGVKLAGDFTNWGAGQVDMTDADGDKVYEYTASLADGTYGYKFKNGDAGWESDPNRQVVVAGAAQVLDVFCFNVKTPGACPSTVIDTLNVTLKVNMANFIATYGNTFSMVSVTGNFGTKAGAANDTTWSDWNPGQIQLTDADGDKVYTSPTFRLPEGTYEYKYIAGDAWGKDELLIGGNRVMVVDGAPNASVEFGPFCFGDKVNNCTDLGAVRNVTVRVDMSNEVYDADSVFVNGTIKFPADTKTKMTETANGSGIFEATVAIPTGFVYGLKFFNKTAGEAGDDLAANGCGLGDFGKNRKMDLPASTLADTTLPCFAFNSCSSACAGFYTAIDGKANTAFTVAPNPFTNRTTVSFNEAGVYNVALISVAGQVVRSFSDVRTNAVEISREGINAGLYLLSVTNESGVRTMTKVVIE